MYVDKERHTTSTIIAELPPTNNAHNILQQHIEFFNLIAAEISKEDSPNSANFESRTVILQQKVSRMVFHKFRKVFVLLFRLTPEKFIHITATYKILESYRSGDIQGG